MAVSRWWSERGSAPQASTAARGRGHIGGCLANTSFTTVAVYAHCVVISNHVQAGLHICAMYTIWSACQLMNNSPSIVVAVARTDCLGISPSDTKLSWGGILNVLLIVQRLESLLAWINVGSTARFQIVVCL